MKKTLAEIITFINNKAVYSEMINKLALTRIPASQSLVFWYEFIVWTVCGNVISSNP